MSDAPNFPSDLSPEEMADYLRLYLDETEELLDALRTGRVAATVEDAPVAELIAFGDPTLRVAATFPTGEQYGIAVAPGDTETLELFNQGLDRARSDGTIARLEQQFLGATPAES